MIYYDYDVYAYMIFDVLLLARRVLRKLFELVGQDNNVHQHIMGLNAISAN
jgi:hypothetical protein